MMDSNHYAPLAIVGMACRLPGANDLESYWDLIARGGCALGEVPPDRFDREMYYDPKKGTPGKAYSLLAGLVPYGPFDEKLCPRPRRLESVAEPGHLMFCQVAAEALRHAGQNPFDLRQRQVGVYVGSNIYGEREIDLAVATLIDDAAQRLRDIDDFRQLPPRVQDEVIGKVIESVRHQKMHAQRQVVGDGHCVAAIVADAMGLTGPAMAFDAACASSLYVLAAAGWALHRGRIEMAILGGAGFFIPDNLVYFSKVQCCSSTGSRPFSRGADGLVASEGYVAVVVKTLERAVADGDSILAVISGLGLSADGRGKALWAPMPEGQIEAIRRAYPNPAQLRRLQYIEAHATSTRLGDTVEMSSLASVTKGLFPAGHKIPLGAVKANIGHTLESAGLAGIVKTVLAMQHRVIPKQIAADPLNPDIPWEELPFVIPRENLEWAAPEDGGPRRAAVNAFGIGGLNGHVVLDEYLAAPARRSLGSVAAATGISAVPAASNGDGDAVAVLGIGCVLPGAANVEAYWNLLLSGRDPKSKAPATRWDPRSRDASASASLGSFIADFQYDWRRHKLPPKQIAQADPLQYMILDAVDAALADGGYAATSEKFQAARDRIGALVGLKFQTEFWHALRTVIRLPEHQREIAAALREQGLPDKQIAAICGEFGQRLERAMPAIHDETGSFIPSTFASRIMKTFNLKGGAATVSAGESSSAAALMCAIDALREGACEMVLCVAGHRTLDRIAYHALERTGRLAHGAVRDPFDAEAAGIVPAEGAGVLLLKKLTDARRDGDPIRGILRGVEGGCAASVQEAVGRAARDAWKDSTAHREELMIAELPGLGDPQQDQEILRRLAQTFGESRRNGPVMVGSVTGQLGHAEGAAGMAAVIKTLLALDHLRMPRSGGLTQPCSVFSDFAHALGPTLAETDLFAPTDSGRILGSVTDCDPYGQAYHIVLERALPAPVQKRAAEGSPEKTEKTPTGFFDATQRRREKKVAEARAAKPASDAVTLLGPNGQPMMLKTRLYGLRIAGVAAAAPDKIATVDNLAALFGREEAERLSASTGIRQRRIAENLCASDLCLPAAEVLLERLGWDRKELGVLVFVSQTPDYISPATACVLHGKLGLSKSCGAFDVNLGCSGYVYGLWLVGSLMAASHIRRGLLLVGDTVSRIISPEDRNVAALFGDAGSATLLECDPAAPPMTFCLGTDGGGMSCLINPAGGFRNPHTPETSVRRLQRDGTIRSDEDLYMNGTAVFAFTIREVLPMIRATLESAGWTADDVDLFLLHQANCYMLDYIVKKMRLPAEKVPYSIGQFGNTSSATLPLTLVAHGDNASKPVSGKCVMAGFGVGLSWASVACTLGGVCVPPLQIVADVKNGC